MQTLTFQNITFSPAKVDNQIWLTSSELAKALDYADQSSVNKIYDRNADEFTSSMTTLIPNPQMKNAKTRIFSLKGCHLIAMFARTKVAKDFRKWVLDILDKEVGQPVQVLTSEQTLALRDAVNMATGVLKLDYSTIYKMIHQRFNVGHIKELSLEQLEQAVEYVHRLMCGSNMNEQDANYNAQWRLIGLLEYDRVSKELRQLQNKLNDLSQDLYRINRTKGLIYDAISEQRIHATDDYKQRLVEAQAFIEKQHEMKCLRF